MPPHPALIAFRNSLLVMCRPRNRIESVTGLTCLGPVGGDVLSRSAPETVCRSRSSAQQVREVLPAVYAGSFHGPRIGRDSIRFASASFGKVSNFGSHLRGR